MWSRLKESPWCNQPPVSNLINRYPRRLFEDTMSNRRFEMFEARAALFDMHQDGSDRTIAKVGMVR